MLTREQCISAARLLSDYKWILAAAFSSASVTLTKENQAKIKEISQLRDALEAQGMEVKS